MQSMVDVDKFERIQNHIMRAFGRTNRFAVIGGPGTGKTVLALEGLNRILSEDRGENVRFLVYNRALHSFLERFVRYSGEEKIINTWHSFIPRYLMKAFDIDFDAFKSRYEIARYRYDFNKILADLKAEDSIHKFDYIFVDEAQDFDETLLEILDHISIKLYVFFDEHQKFTPELLELDSSFSAVEQTNILSTLDLEEDFYDLTVNFRNTGSIEKVAKLYDFNYMVNNITLRRTTITKEGRPPELIECRERERLVNHIVEEHKKAPDRTIGVLVPKFASQKDVLDTYKDLFQKHNDIDKDTFYVHSSQDKRALNEQGIFLMTYQIAKGLEFDHVYLVELNHESFIFDHYHKNAFYVSITRAKDHLSLVYDDTKKDSEVIRKAKQQASLFKTIELKEGDTHD